MGLPWFSWGCHGPVVAKWHCHGNAVHYRGLSCDVMGLSWLNGNDIGPPWDTTGLLWFMALRCTTVGWLWPSDCHGIPWHDHGFMGLPWAHSTATGLHWDCHGFVSLRWGHHGMSWECLSTAMRCHGMPWDAMGLLWLRGITIGPS